MLSRLRLSECRWLAVFLPVVLVINGWLTAEATAQRPLTSQQTRKIRLIESGIEKAGRLYQNGKVEASAKLIRQNSDALQELAENPTPELIAAVQATHNKLREAREALVAAGASLPVIPDLPEPKMEGDVPVRFSRDVAPILSSRCGRCHIGRTRGEFSMATFQSLASGLGGSPVIVPEKPDESYLIEVIEEGDMPPDGQVSEKEVETLKQWIADGAKFDGQSLDQNIGDIARAATLATNSQVPVMRPAGNETVSFAADVAPVIVANCVGCHFEAQNARGGLRMTNINQLLRGGDSGPIVKPGDADGSVLIQRLTATDNSRMPRGRRVLRSEVIEKIKTWVNEGARFDGRQPGMNLREVGAIAKSERATHEELMAERRERVVRNWNIVMSGADDMQVSTDDVLVIGTTDNRWLNDIGDFGDATAVQIKEVLKLDADQPLVKGQISMFVFDGRYDYTEFGKMVESRDLPRHWQSHWGYDTVDAYVAALVDSDGFDGLKPALTQHMASVAVASLASDVPRWFADGMGYVLADAILDDPKLQDAWIQQSLDAFRASQDEADFMQGRLPEDQAGLVAFNFLRSLFGNSNGDLADVLRGMCDGETFDAAFRSVYELSPVELLRHRTGGLRDNNRQRRNPRRNR